MLSDNAMPGSPRLERAYAGCRRLARRHYENFPVASRLLPPAMRPHVAAVYAFARRADDFADEGDRSPRERLALLDDCRRRLRAAARGPAAATEGETDPVLLALGNTMRVCDLPLTLFEDLLSAFRQDVTVRRYRTWDDLLDYCGRSANPVGRIVLRIGGFRDATLDRAADRICTALQITNFLQDFRRDWERGRLYVPAEIRARCGAREEDLGAAALAAPWRAALAETAGRTRALFEEGRDLCDRLPGRLGLELRLTWLGGRRILDRLERTGCDPFVRRPALGAPDYAPLLWRALLWRPASRPPAARAA